MRDRFKRSREGAGGLAALFTLSLGALLVFSAVGIASFSGLLNPSFEQGSGSSLDGWTVKAYDYDEDGGDSSGVREQVYGPGQNPVPCVQGDPYGVCVVSGSDTFAYRDDIDDPERQMTVPVLDGAKMVRLGGPFKGPWIRQAQDGLAIQQSFVVNEADPVISLNYNFFSYDYTGYDELYLRVRVVSPGEPTIFERLQGGFGSGTALKTTGWRDAALDLSDYAGEEVKLDVELRGTKDTLYGSWAYLDAGTSPTGVVDTDGTVGTAPATTPGGEPVTVHKYVDENSGLIYFTVPASQVSAFPDECMPFEINVPLDPGSGQISNVSARLNSESTSLTQVSPNLWKLSFPCVSSGDIWLSYTLTEDGSSQQFIVPLGGLTLIDPQGVVYDADIFADLKAAGQSDEQARTASAIQGATVRLQRLEGDTFVNVLSGDPGISPKVNPQITGPDGEYQWDVSAGTYRVVVSKGGFVSVESAEVDIPPPVLDLHIPMSKVRRTLSVTKIGNGAGTVTSSPAGIACGSSCTEDFEEGAEVVLTAVAGAGSSFSGWTGACSGTGACELTMDEAKSLGASFAKIPTISRKPALGRLSVTPAKASAKPGKSVIFSVRVKNKGTATAAGIKVCGKLPRKIGKAPVCLKRAMLAPGKTLAGRIKVILNGKAPKGKNKVRFTASAKSVKPVKRSVSITVR
jgi:uncharacterized repeat protein (TIGR01451 family)